MPPASIWPSYTLQRRFLHQLRRLQKASASDNVFFTSTRQRSREGGEEGKVKTAFKKKRDCANLLVI